MVNGDNARISVSVIDVGADLIEGPDAINSDGDYINLTQKLV